MIRIRDRPRHDAHDLNVTAQLFNADIIHCKWCDVRRCRSLSFCLCASYAFVHADIVGIDGSTSRRTLSQVTLPANANADQLAAFIYNLLSSGQTSSAASAIAQASAQGSTGADAIATALATAASTVFLLFSHSKSATVLPLLFILVVYTKSGVLVLERVL